MNGPMTFKDMLDQYLEYRKTCGLTLYPTLHLMTFFNHTTKIWPDCPYLRQDMVDWWAQRTKGEKNWNSTRSRVYPLLAFLKWTNARGWTDMVVPTLPSPVKHDYIPHAFTETEICNLLESCNAHYSKKRNQISFQLLKVEYPVMILLMYSSGMRTTEVRLLRTEDVNLATGAICIKHTKGYGEHTIVLHDSTLEMMRAYDKKISCIIPNRTIFFPTKKDTCHTNATLPYHWRKFWKIENEGHSHPYELRHNYATKNIMSWDSGGAIDDRLLALSKSMGHSVISSTLSYFSLVPGYAQKIETLFGHEYADIIPKFPQNEE